MIINLYTKDNCPYCTQAKQFLEERGLKYTKLHLGWDITREEIIEQFPGVRTMPIIEIDGKHIGGFEDLVKYFEEK